MAYEMIRQRRLKKSGRLNTSGIAPFATAAMVTLMLGCSSGPETIRFGKDGCDHCKMTIMDKKSGGEIVTQKGKIYRFDDIRCIIDFINSGKVDKQDHGTVYLLDYIGNGNLLIASEAFLLKSESLHSPMGGNMAAFATEAARNKKMNELKGTSITWAELIK
jgi:copper chaperone NosL